ncbi:YidB family protein [Roseomonas gilardii subsp. gilardii]|uniref:YidB family protein n=1 Tax=Roseomonas gilardii TaxID=257708 RepID=UPI001FF9B1D0|nr:YidB family protein [Roseomonas gilardii]UPG71586.1 YidB family protein [Roseomonas gilardii subsp. gilardii]
MSGTAPDETPAGGVGITQIHEILSSLMGGRTDSAGVQELVGRLRQGGMESQVESWVGTGENQPADGTSIERAFGSSTIDNVASRFGMTRDQLVSLLVMALPLVLDHLTPKGRVPANDAEMPSGGLQGGLGGILGRALGGLGGGSASGQGGSSAGDIVGGLLRSVLGGQRGA